VKVSSLRAQPQTAEPEALARLAAFALSDAAPHMTGAHLKIDSGRTIA